MIILAAAIILALDNAGIINKANEAVEETDLAQAKHLAALKWSEAYLDDSITDKQGYVISELAKQGITEEKYKITFTENGVDVELKDASNVATGSVIPEGGTYYVGVTDYRLGSYAGATKTYTAGQSFPATVNAGDVYVYNGYEYRYNYTLNTEMTNYWAPSIYNTGWGVKLLDSSKAPQGWVLATINGKKLVDMSETFGDCTSLTTLEGLTIPNSVTNMFNTFSGCSGLTTLEGLTIPNSVTDMANTFNGCSGLTTLEGLTIPNSVTNMFNTFSGCSGLTTLEGLTIPSGVTNMRSTFNGCSGLTTLAGLTISNGVTYMDNTFYGCSGLTTLAGLTIPNSVTDMTSTFKGCTGLITAGGLVIPSSVTSMPSTFKDCKSLTGTIEINAILSYGMDGLDCFECFYNTKITEITGTTNAKAELLASKEG